MGLIIETPRLRLREFAPADADAIFRVIGDPKTMLFYPRPFTREQADEWITRNQERYRHEGHGLWAAVLKEKGALVGDCGLVKQDVEGEVLTELAYHFHRDFWGQGYATEAARACMAYGFETLGLPKLISLIRPENMPSARVAQRNGLRIERPIVRWELLHDVWAMTRQEWQKTTASPASAASRISANG